MNTLLEVPDVNHAQLAVRENGWKDVVQKQDGQPVYHGHAAIKCQLPGHEVPPPPSPFAESSMRP